MIAVIQRVTSAAVTVARETVGQIGPGLLVLVSVCTGDTDQDVQWMAAKLVSLRVFRSATGDKHFDRDVRETTGSILLVSNFTVAADARKGRRPSFDRAAGPPGAENLFNALVDAVRATGVPVANGRFAADMLVSLTNDGPATFLLDSPGGKAG